MRPKVGDIADKRPAFSGVLPIFVCNDMPAVHSFIGRRPVLYNLRVPGAPEFPSKQPPEVLWCQFRATPEDWIGVFVAESFVECWTDVGFETVIANRVVCDVDRWQWLLLQAEAAVKACSLLHVSEKA